MSENTPGVKTNSKSVYLLPYFDEYLVAYKDRSTAVDRKYSKLIGTANGIFNPVIIINGKVTGTWKRTFLKDKVNIEIKLLTSVSKINKRSIIAKAKRYAKFLSMPPAVSFK